MANGCSRAISQAQASPSVSSCCRPDPARPGSSTTAWKTSPAAPGFPDGKRFVYSAREKGHLNRIRVQSLEGGDARPLSPEGVFLRPSTNPVTPDGKFVLGIHRGGREASLYPVEGSGGEARPVAGLEANDWPVQWSQMGASFTFTSIAESRTKSGCSIPSAERRRRGSRDPARRARRRPLSAS